MPRPVDPRTSDSIPKWKGMLRPTTDPASAIPRWTFRVGLLTPVFGGGVVPARVEEDRPFRVPSIRGQLRFWWRATQAARFDLAPRSPGQRIDYRPLREAEALLWGMASVAWDASHGRTNEPMASAVRIVVEEVEGSVQVRQMTDRRAPIGSGLGYLYFPAREIRGPGARPAQSYWFGPSARVRVELDLTQVRSNLARLPSFAGQELDDAFREDLVKQVAGALWAWGCFGGIGARTRRGAGAVVLERVEGPHAQAIAPRCRSAAELLRAIETAAGTFVCGTSEHAWDVPVLKGAFVALADLDPGGRQRNVKGEPGPVLEMPERIADAVGKVMQHFRQGVGLARNPGQGNRPGRSRWPEADALRRMLNRWSPNHEPRLPVFFPRAAFGLPIVFRFQTQGDPEGQITLTPAGGLRRMASPLILRPYRLEGTDRYALVGLMLNTRIEPPEGLEVQHGHRTIPVSPEAEPVAGDKPFGPKVQPLRESGGGPAPWALLGRIADKRAGRIRL